MAALTDWSRFALVNRERFAAARFVKFGDARGGLVSSLQARAGGSVTLFALSDLPVLYILTGQRAVWMAEHAECLPRGRAAAGRRVARSSRRDYVVFDSSQLDGRIRSPW